MAYVLGPIALTQQPWVVVAVAVSAALLLSTREQLHRVTQRVPQDELLTAGKFLVLVGIILPLVPDRAGDDVDGVDAVQGLARRRCDLLAFVCKLPAATLCSLARRNAVAGSSRRPLFVDGNDHCARQAAAARVSPKFAPIFPPGSLRQPAIMYVRLGIVTALFNLQLAVVSRAGPCGTLCDRGHHRNCRMAIDEGAQCYRHVGSRHVNPLQIPTAVLFAVIADAAISISMTVWTRTAFGQSGILALAAIVGVTDIDPFVVNIAQGGVSGVSSGMLAAAVLIAASANNVAKACYAIAVDGGKLARTAGDRSSASSPHLGLIAAGSVIWLMGLR